MIKDYKMLAAYILTAVFVVGVMFILHNTIKAFIPKTCPECICQCDKAIEIGLDYQERYLGALNESYRFEKDCTRDLRSCETLLEGCVKRFQKTVKSPKAIR